MKRANSSTVRTALHEMRMYMNGAPGVPAFARIVLEQVEVIRRAVEDDDLGDFRDTSGGVPQNEVADVLPDRT